MITNIIDQLLRDEGFRENPYLDTKGISTVGIGHNLQANPLPNEVYPMALDRAKDLLCWDLQRINTKLCSDMPWITKLPAVYSGVLTNMSFNMGANGLEQFHHMLSYMQIGEYALAAVEGKNSSWYTQVGDRAKRLMDQLRLGEWQ